MADISLNQKNLQELLEAFDHYFPEKTVYSSDKPYFSGEFNWNKRTSFIEFVNELIKESGVKIESERDIKGVREAQKELVKLVNNKNVEKPIDTNTDVVDTQKLKQFEEEAARIEATKLEIKTKKEAEIKAWIESQKKLYDQEIQRTKIAEAKLKAAEKPVYVKVTIPEQKLTQDQEINLKTLEEAAQANPQQLVKDVQAKIEEKISAAKPENITPEEINVVTELAATEVVESLVTHQSAIVRAAIVNTTASDPKIKSETRTEIKDIADILADQNLTKAEVSQKIAEFYFGKEVAAKILGPTDISQVKIDVSDTPSEGYIEVRPSTILIEHLQNLNSQNVLLNNLTGFSEQEIKSHILKGIGTKLESHIANLQPNSLVAKTYNSDAVQLALRSFGIAQTSSWVAVEGSFVGRIAVSSGFGHVAGLIQTKTGVNLGVKLASRKIAGQAAGKAAAGFLSKIITTLGGAAAPETFGLSLIISAAIGKILELIPLDGIKRFIDENKEVFLFGGVATMFLIPGTLGTALGGVSAFLGGASALASGGISMTSFLTSVRRGVEGVTSVVADSIGKPILITLLTLPVVVALILFIINSGAYIVPQGSDRSNTPSLGPNQMGGLVSICKESGETGKDITEQLARSIKNGVVNILPEIVWGRRDGICIKPTMIVMHWSAGTNDNPDGNDRTYETLVQRKLSCQLATDINDTWLMERFFEKEVEFPACAGEWNTFSINNELAGNYFTATPPPPNSQELELAYSATCKVMKQYDIPWSQIYGHYNVPGSGKIDPGVDFLEKVFIPEIRRRCPNGS